MKIVVIGGPGVVGTGIVNLLKKEHEVISVGKSRGDYQADLLQPDTIENLFETIGTVDGIISTIGDGTMAPLIELEAKNFLAAFNSKLVANINLLQAAKRHLNTEGFILFTSGIASMEPIPGSATLSVACAAIEAVVRSSAIENTNGIRINAVSPTMIKETMELFGMDSSTGISSANTALVFKHLIDSKASGVIADVREYLPKLTESN